MASSIHWKIILLTACLCWSSCLSQNPDEDLLLASVREAVERIKVMAEKVEDLHERLDGLKESQMAVQEKVEALQDGQELLRDQLVQLQESSQSENQMEIFAEMLKLDRDLPCREDHFTQLQTHFSTELQKIERSIEGCSSVEQQLSNLTMVLTKDDCAEGSHRCSPLAVCEDAIVSYRCICLPGYTGDGFTCEEVPLCVHPNFTIPGIKGCLTAVRERKTWFEASRHCSDGGGRLLEGWDSNAQSEVISDYVDKALGESFNEVYVGVSYRRWTEGEVNVPAVLFINRNPAIAYLRNNRYGSLSAFSNRLIEDSGTFSKYFVCQRTSPPSSSSSVSSINNDHDDD